MILQQKELSIVGVIGKLVIWHLERVLIVAAILAILLFYLWLFGWLNRGNRRCCRPNQDRQVKNSPLQGKNIFFLGSSVTKGLAAKGNSFVEFLQVQHAAQCIKDAVNGTTLVDNGAKSYVSRLKHFDPKAPCDLFVCQLSTNDATRKSPLGTLSNSMDPATFDTKTIYGAIEYIIAYAKSTWGCPVVFFTNPQYNSVRYRDMVCALKAVAEKWKISVIDLWDNREINTKFNCKPYMNDKIHPTMLGYQQWTNVMAQQLSQVLQGKVLTMGEISPVPQKTPKEKRKKTVPDCGAMCVGGLGHLHSDQCLYVCNHVRHWQSRKQF